MADNFLALLEKEKPGILQTLPPWLTPERWWALALQVARNPALQRCSWESLIDSVRQLAAWGLELDGEEATIIPYGQTATPTAMVKGMIRRVVESGAAMHLYAELICEGEHVKVFSGTTGRSIDHELCFGRRGTIIGAYAVVILPGGITDFEMFGASDIEAVEKAALRISQGKPSPAWQNFRGEMIKKSVIRRLCKRLRGKRDTEEGRRYATMMDGMKRVDPEPTPPLTDAEMPKAAEEAPAVIASHPLRRPPSPPPIVPPGGIEVASSTPANGYLTDADINDIAAICEAQGITMKAYRACVAAMGVTEDRKIPRARLDEFTHKLMEAAQG